MMPAPVSLTLQASYAHLRAGAEALGSLLAQSGAPAELASGCELALQELLTNIVDHAYDEDATRQIGLRLQVENTGQERRLTIETEDGGRPAEVDLQSVAMPDPLDLQEGGYGMAIITSLMDEVSYRRDGSNNRWKLVKVFQPQLNRK